MVIHFGIESYERKKLYFIYGCYRLQYSFSFCTPSFSMKLDKVIGKFEAYLIPKRTITYSRFTFFKYRQKIE